MIHGNEVTRLYFVGLFDVADDLAHSSTLQITAPSLDSKPTADFVKELGNFQINFQIKTII
jgi:hypothetical protein